MIPDSEKKVVVEVQHGHGSLALGVWSPEVCLVLVLDSWASSYTVVEFYDSTFLTFTQGRA